MLCCLGTVSVCVPPPLTQTDEVSSSILTSGDSVPDPNSWILVDTTIGGEPLDHPIIAFRKRKFSGRPDHITKVPCEGAAMVVYCSTF